LAENWYVDSIYYNFFIVGVSIFWENIISKTNTPIVRVWLTTP